MLVRLIAIADEPTDDDDVRLRKRVGVVAGYLTVLATLGLPAFGQGAVLSLVLGVGMSALSAVNLAILARTRRFDRYVSAIPNAISAVSRPTTTPRTKMPSGTLKNTCWMTTIAPANRYGIARSRSRTGDARWISRVTRGGKAAQRATRHVLA